MRINHNISALNTYRQLSTNGANTAKSLEKLSSGLRINRAADDAAGLAISEKMRSQIRGLDSASRNAEDGVSLVQTAEGSLSEVSDMLVRLKELAVQSANGTYQDAVDREALQTEVSALKSEINRVSSSTNFNGISLLDGSLKGATVAGAGFTAAAGIVGLSGAGLDAAPATYTLGYDTGTSTFTLVADPDGAGAAAASTYTKVATIPTGFDTSKVNFEEVGLEIEVNAALVADITDAPLTVTAGTGLKLQIGDKNTTSQQLELSIESTDTTKLGIAGIDISTQAGASAAINLIDTAINTVSSTRANLGALQNRLDHTIKNLGTTGENLTASESRVRDVDMAKEMMEYTKNNILNQAAQSMLAQANSAPQGVLQLLQ